MSHASDAMTAVGHSLLSTLGSPHLSVDFLKFHALRFSPWAVVSWGFCHSQCRVPTTQRTPPGLSFAVCRPPRPAPGHRPSVRCAARPLQDTAFPGGPPSLSKVRLRLTLGGAWVRTAPLVIHCSGTLRCLDGPRLVRPPAADVMAASSSPESAGWRRVSDSRR